MARFTRLISERDISQFKEIFCGEIHYDIPLYYFTGGECYALIKESYVVTEDGLRREIDILGGFCLVNKRPNLLRSIRQMPKHLVNYYTRLDSRIFPDHGKVAEFTGYFLKNKKHGLYFTMQLVKTCILHKANRFVYSYPKNQTRLASYYSKGDPVRLHTGVPKSLPGHKEHMEEECVEVVTTWGIVKIFLARTLKEISRKFK